MASRLRKFDPSEVKTYRMDGKGTNVGGASVIVPDPVRPRHAERAQGLPRSGHGGRRPQLGPTAPGDTSGATDTSAPATSSTPTSSAGGAVVIEDNGVGIFPPDDPTCR